MRILFTLALVALSATPAMAHTGNDGFGFASGFFHPLFGWDHIAAMVAVGLWGAFLGRPAIYILPITFPLVMALGGTLGIVGVALPGVEAGIAASALILGLCVMMAARPPLWLAAVAVGVFAIFHGHAHGTELPDAANPFGYAVGFVIATGLLHISGILIGALTQSAAGRIVVRGAGALIALAGIVFLTEIGG
ncbi:MAG: hupE [Rhodospirillales bacterium]|nr:hupE [Rhodospirillales bacterium]